MCICSSDVNECLADTPHGGLHLCDVAGGAVCVNTPGSYRCVCASGMGSPNGLHGCESRSCDFYVGYFVLG